MLERERLESKKISKTNAVTSIMGHELPADDVHVGPSDYVPWLTDRKWAHIRMEGQAFGDVPLNVELKLEVWDSPNSAGIVIDAVRCCKLALNNGIGGQLDGPSSYLMKSPQNQRPDSEARDLTEAFIAGPSASRSPAPRRRRPTASIPDDMRLEPPAPARGYRSRAARPRSRLPVRVGGRLRRRAPCRAVGAEALAARGHRVLVVAPSHSATLVRESRRAIRAARDDPASLLPAPGETRLLGVGEVVSLTPSRRRAPSVPVDVARTLEEALTIAPLDIVHVHEPWAPSTSSAALRHSRALNVGTFHAPAERIAGHPGRPPGRRAALRPPRRAPRLLPGHGRAAAPLLRRRLPPILPGVRRADPGGGAGGARPTFCFVDEEERAALRDVPARAAPPARRTSTGPRACASRRESAPSARCGATSASASSGCRAARRGGAGRRADRRVRLRRRSLPSPGGVLRALAAGAVPLTSRLPVYEELLDDGGRGLVFEARDVDVLAAQLDAAGPRRGAGRAPARGRGGAGRAPRAGPRGGRARGGLQGLVARRHDDRERPQVRARIRARPLIDVDLHMHTDHSNDCATPVEVLLSEAKARGLGAIAVTDHNEISGAHDARAKADGIKVIVGEEVKTDGQGEVIGLFIEEKIPRGMSLAETIAEIQRQGGLAYVPHPFDRMHSVPDYEHLLPVLDDIDAIEIFNPRIAIPEFNEEAVRFAAKYRIPAGAGSDAHVPQGLGSVRIRMRDFDGPEEFLESLREADVIRRPASLLYVQALKFLQTTALPSGARAAVRARRVKRAERKS